MTDQTDIATAHLDLGELIRALEAEDPAMVVPLGFDSPHSYRGYYEQLAFEPATNITVGAMLAAARTALGTTYQGYKGGDYAMREHTPCWLAEYGCTGETIGRTLLRLMLAAPGPAASEERIPPPNPEGVLGWIADRIDARRWPLAEHGYPAHLHGIDDGTAVLDLLPADADLVHAWEDLPDPVVSYRIALTPIGPDTAETSTEGERRQMACPMTHLPEMPCGACGKPAEGERRA